MNITRRLLPTSLAILLSACAVVVHAADLEVAPLFAGYELGCGISGAAQGLVVWANPDQKGRLASVDTLPTVWRSHIGKPIVTDEIDHWYVKVPLRQVLFRGLRLTRLERWYGKNNGISGWLLVLDAPLAKARRRIDENRFKLDENGNFKPELVADDNGRQTRLICDVSM